VSETLVEDRRRPVHGATNLRDLGGYRTTDGATVKWQTLYRSNELSKLDEAARVAFHAVGIRTICDFRNDEERTAAPTPLSPDDPAEIRHLPIKVTAGVGEVLTGGTATAADVRNVLKEIYRLFAIEHAPAYRLLFSSLVDGAVFPLAFHCTAGKDRTGVAAALVLSALGVPRDTIFEDYLLTNDYWDAPTDLLANLSGDVRSAVLEAHPEYLEAAFGAIVARFGSVENYLHDAMGLTPGRRRHLRERLLT